MGTTYAKKTKQPNVIIIYTDDMGYGDLGCYGNPTIRTPHLDRMANEGIKFSQFYVASPVCTPSRSALMTGCYPKRIGLHQHVLFPYSKKGLNPKEETIATLLKNSGYATGCFGKWHLGHQPEFLPPNHGFQEFKGYPFSNDMSRAEQYKLGRKTDYGYELPVVHQTDTVEMAPDQRLSTRRVTNNAVAFIKKHKKHPFFMYVAHPMPHIPIYSSDEFKGRSARGRYGDTIEEIDWSVGQIMETLEKLNLEENTLVFFASDNGPWKVYGVEGGSSGPLRGAKGTTWEGGMRVPFIAWWPKTLKPDHNTSVLTNMDILPTVVELAGAQMPKSTIDGHSFKPVLMDETASWKAQPFLYYSSRGTLEGIRKGAWKLLHQKEKWYLFNIQEDISEAYNLYKKRPEKVKELQQLMEQMDKQITEGAREVGVSQFVAKKTHYPKRENSKTKEYNEKH
jgi:arylsulfatase A-like enzyme